MTPDPEEPAKAFKVLTDEDTAKLGLSNELTEADMNPPKEAPPAQLPALQTTVVDQGVRSTPPRVVESGPPADPPPVPWDRLPERTRIELEAGRRALGGGLSARQAYEATFNPKVVPGTTLPLFPDPEPPPAELTARTLAEQEAGRNALRDRYGVQAAALQQVAATQAAQLEAKAEPSGDEMNYNPGEPPPPV